MFKLNDYFMIFLDERQIDHVLSLNWKCRLLPLSNFFSPDKKNKENQGEKRFLLLQLISSKLYNCDIFIFSSQKTELV